VPHLGINGSALATLICYGLLAVLTARLAGHAGRLRRSPLQVRLALLVAIAASLLLSLVRSNSVPVLGARVLGAVACGVWASYLMWRIVSMKGQRGALHRRAPRLAMRLLSGPVYAPPSADGMPSQPSPTDKSSWV
jgi:hypothetical protein